MATGATFPVGTENSRTDESEQELQQQKSNTSLSRPEEPPLFPGERFQVVAKDVTHLCPFYGPIRGQLHVSNYKLCFVPKKTDGGASSSIMEVPLGLIQRVEKLGGQSSKGENAYGLEIHCKDIRTLRFGFVPENHSRRLIFERIQMYAFPFNFNLNVFAFSAEFGDCPADQNGWNLYHPLDEYKRQGHPFKRWRLTDINQDYSLCDSYPSKWCVPADMTDDELRVVASFRSRGRIPVLSFIHPENQATIVRCSQPRVGVSGKRCPEDEKFVRSIIEANPNSARLAIFDARPRINAVANQAKGAGYESTAGYPNCEVVFLNIANIHVMRDSLKKLKDVCFPTIDNAHWLSNIEATHWLEHLKLVIGGAVRIVDLVERQGCSVLLHCSDGWDRTAQLSSLAMMMLDPYFRTLRGFQVLIEKEWLSFGHKFATRHGHGDKNYADDQRAPIFIQFLDCVYQCTLQYPCSFEFNEAFLLALADHVYSCLFGTFLFNSEYERVKADVMNKTTSIWTYLNASRKLYTNPLYIPPDLQQQVITPVASIRRLQLWTAYHVRWNPRMQPQESIHERSREMVDAIARMEAEIERLERLVSNTSPSKPVLETAM